MAGTNLEELYRERTPGSERLHRRSLELFPNGTTHVGRHLQPYPLYVDRAAGSRKWDVDGNEYVDFFGGHGSMILGHCRPEVTEAVRRQAGRGNQFGAEHELALEWAELIRDMIPCAEAVRFTSSGTEATQLALRLARAATGKSKMIRFAGHFHGWHDQVAFSAMGSNDPAGVPKATVEQAIVVEPNDTAAVVAVLESRDDVAAVILEPTGAAFGRVPTGGDVLRALREMTQRRGVVLIFDEVITGFRCAPGGAQEHYGVTPDLTSLAKIVAGGYPGAAVVGKAALFDSLRFGDAGEGVSPPPIPHQGTFNASAVSSAAGIATLRLLRSGEEIRRANETAATLRNGMNEAARRSGSSWRVYGEFSSFHIFTNPEGQAVEPEDIPAGRVPWQTLKSGAPGELVHQVRLAFLCAGVDIAGWPGGLLSSAHAEEDVERTLSAWDTLLASLGQRSSTELS